MPNAGLIVVFVTCGPDDDGRIAEVLVNEGLAACVNIIPARSVYRWQGKLNNDEESLLIIKSSSNIYSRLEERIKQIHPYEVPEIVAIEPAAVEKNYLKWALGQTGKCQ